MAGQAGNPSTEMFDVSELKAIEEAGPDPNNIVDVGEAFRLEARIVGSGQVWNNLKNHGVGKRIPQSREHLKHIVLCHLRSLQRMPDIIRGFFRQRDVCYAADAY